MPNVTFECHMGQITVSCDDETEHVLREFGFIPSKKYYVTDDNSVDIVDIHTYNRGGLIVNREKPSYKLGDPSEPMIMLYDSSGEAVFLVDSIYIGTYQANGMDLSRRLPERAFSAFNYMMIRSLVEIQIRYNESLEALAKTMHEFGERLETIEELNTSGGSKGSSQEIYPGFPLM